MKPQGDGRVRCSAWLGGWVIAKAGLGRLLNRKQVRLAQSTWRSILEACGGAVPSRYELRLQCRNLALKTKVLALQCLLAERRLSLFLLGHVLRPFGKTAFRPVNGERVLAAIRAMPVRSWQYKSQDASIRHMGPTAQDFRAAFALGESDTTITTVDADGVALAAARALEARTRTQGVTLAALRRENAALRTAVADVRRTSAALRTQLTVLLTRADEDRALRTRLARLAERLEGLDPATRAVVAGRP